MFRRKTGLRPRPQDPSGGAAFVRDDSAFSPGPRPPRLGPSHRPWLSPANVLRKASHRPALPRAPFAQSIGRLFADADRFHSSMVSIPSAYREHDFRNIDYVSAIRGLCPRPPLVPGRRGQAERPPRISRILSAYPNPSPRLQPPPRLFKASHRPAPPRAPFAQSIGRL